MLLFLSQNPQNRQNISFELGKAAPHSKLDSEWLTFRRQPSWVPPHAFLEVLHCFAGFVIITIHCVTTSPDSS